MALPHPVAAWDAGHEHDRRSLSNPRWPVAAAGALVLLTIPPVLIAGLLTPAGSVFTGYVVIARDAFVYQALWRQGWSGSWLFHSPYSSENLPGVLLYPWYLWPAHLIGWAAGPVLYHLLRLGAGAALLAALWLLICQLFRARLLRAWALVLCVLGGGIGIVLPHEIRIGPLVTGATEMRSPGSSVADLIAMAPHLPGAMALMCWVMTVALRLRHRVRRTELISALAALIGLQLIYPQLALLAVVVIAAWAVAQGHGEPRRFALLGGALQVPYLAYLAAAWWSNPLSFAAIRSSLDIGDPFGFIVLSHLVASGLIGVALWRRRLRGDLWLPAFWISGMTVFMFLPGVSGLLGRSFMASSIPFGLCATAGLLSLLRGVRGRAWRRRVATMALAASSLYGIFSLAQPFSIAAFRLDPRAEYEPAAEARLLQQAAPRLTASDIILTTYLEGVYVPAETDARAFVGHPDMTLDAAQKSSQANAFFTSWNADQRARFLKANRIDYVLSTDGAAIARLAADPHLTAVEGNRQAALFAVRR